MIVLRLFSDPGSKDTEQSVPEIIMAILEKDKVILQKLATELVAIADLPIQKQKAEMWRRLNRLEPVKVMVWINEIPWHEMGPELELKTNGKFCC